MTTVNRILEQCVQDGACLLWTGVLKHGYGYISTHGAQKRVHRVIYEHHHGPIPTGLTIDHVKARGCHSRACCNIDHLEAVTNKENILRGDGLCGMNARKTHCKRGHLLEPTNLVPCRVLTGRRTCVICARENASRYRNKLRAKEDHATASPEAGT